MARRAQRARTGSALAPRVVYLPDALTRTVSVELTPRQLAAKRVRDHQRYLVWKERQIELAARDRQVRRFWLGFGLAVGTGLLATVCGAGWWLWQSLKAATFHFNPGVAVLVLVLFVVGAKLGHRCVTIVQHWHG